MTKINDDNNDDDDVVVGNDDDNTIMSRTTPAAIGVSLNCSICLIFVLTFDVGLLI